MSFYSGAKKQSSRDNPAEEEMKPSSSSSANPHNPSFVTKVPWYANTGKNEDSLDHQKNQSKSTVPVPLGLYTKRGVGDDVKTSFVIGSCLNCGSRTHSKKDCLERPRKIGAKYSNKNLASDDILGADVGREVFESKRDRWRGFEPEDYEDSHPPAVSTNLPLLRAELNAKLAMGLISIEEYTDAECAVTTAGNVKVDKKLGEVSSAANLRVREDVAKYLLNLDVNSAYYDPKSRSMREDPKAPNSAYRGDNFERFSGETNEAINARAFAWKSEIANPTETSKRMVESQTQAKILANKRKLELEQLYGPTN